MSLVYADEERYVTFDEIRERTQEAFDVDEVTDGLVAIYIARTGLEEVTACSLCDRSLAHDSELPICDRCQRTAKAHARAEQARIEWERDGRPD